MFLQLFEQQSALELHGSFLRPQVCSSQVSVASLQVSPLPQGSPVDEQSLEPSQNSLPLQNRPSSGHCPLSGVFVQLPSVSQTSTVHETPSLQSALVEQVTRQSIAQLLSSSLPSQVPSPQHDPTAGVSVQVLPLPVQRESPQKGSVPQQ